MSNDESTKMHLFVSHRIKHKKIARKNLVPGSFSNQCCFLSTSHEVRLRLHTNKHHMYSKKKMRIIQVTQMISMRQGQR